MNYKNLIAILSASLIIFACANIKDPSGGPGIVAPPVIEEYSPAMNTINFSGDAIELEFSEYMKKSDVQENVFINPAAKMSFDWSGTSLTVEFPDGLDSNTTYSFQLGTSYTDHYGNKPSQSFSLVFSTGNVLDSGKIVGRLFDSKPEGDFIYAYNLGEYAEDTLDIRAIKPKYRTQLGTNGNFKLNALKPGKYRLFVVSDEFKDNKYTEGIDKYSSAPADVEVRDSIVPFVSLRIGNAIDLTPPALLDAESVHEKMFVARFSETLDTTNLSPDSFIIRNENNDIRKITGIIASQEDASKWYLRIDMPIDTNSTWNLYANNASVLKDSTGNSMQDSSAFCRLFASEQPDTNNIILRSFNLKDSTENILMTHYPTLSMSDVFSVLDSSAIEFIRMEDAMPISFMPKVKGADLIIIPGADYLSNKWYKLKIDLNKILCLNGTKPKDTVITVRYKTEDIRNYVRCSGKVNLLPETDRLVVVMKDSKGIRYYSTVSTDSTWAVENLSEGEYSFEAFIDANGNGQYDYGTAFPFSFSEKFYLINKKATLKKRWDTEDVMLILEEM